VILLIRASLSPEHPQSGVSPGMMILGQGKTDSDSGRVIVLSTATQLIKRSSDPVLQKAGYCFLPA
jgi:hypothetical protein